jgi:exodeoxyribonuclease VII large subunit
VVSAKIKGWVERLGSIWVEGQLVQLNRRPGSAMSFAVLRDPEENCSLAVAVYSSVLDQMDVPVEEGARVVVDAKPTFWAGRGSLQLQARELRPVGVGDLLARIERLKRQLAAEGLFDRSRKTPLPLIPNVIGLICGRASKAEHDVVANASARWPAVRFEIRPVAVQGQRAAAEVAAALAQLDADPAVDVIVIARGGGAVEDLLPFSDQRLIRAVAAAATPVVSAIGHETDSPLLDLVADLRASTPTDAAKRIVPDLAAELAGLARARAAMRAAAARRIASEQARLDAARSRPALANPDWILLARQTELAALRADSRAACAARIDRSRADAATLAAQLAALSPEATLRRGYAVVRNASDGIVRHPDDAVLGLPLTVRVAGGEFRAARTA